MSSPLADVTEWEKFLDDNYHQLSRRIRVESLITRLRSDSIINVDDYESVLNQYCTQFLKAGHLIDIVKTKGRIGFEKFMEAVEYEYPEVYFETTGKKARQEKAPQRITLRETTSILVLDKMGDLIHSFTEQLTKNKMELRGFQSLVAELKADLEKQLDEKFMMEDQIKQLTELVQELRNDKKDLTETLSKERQAKKEIETQYDKFREVKLDEFYHFSREPFSRFLSPNPCTSEKRGMSNSFCGRGKTPPLKDTKLAGIQMAVDEGKIGRRIADEGPNKTMDAQTMQKSLCQLQESNDRLQCCIEEFKKEVEQCRSKQHEAEGQSRLVTLENEKMKMEMKKMEDQCKIMADMIKRLKNEIDNRQPKPKPMFPIPRMFPESNSSVDEDNNDKSMCQSSTVLNRSSKGEQKKAAFETAPATSALLQSSFGMFTNPVWKSTED